MATTSCSSSFVYHDCLITSLPKRRDFFWRILADVDIISFHRSLKNWPNIWDRTSGTKAMSKGWCMGKSPFIEGVHYGSEACYLCICISPSHNQRAYLSREKEMLFTGAASE